MPTKLPHDKPIPSRVAILQHPLHPMVVVFPISFLQSTLISDGLFWWLGNDFWALVSFWLTAAGLTMGCIAALLGFADFLLMKQVRQHIAAWSHMIVGIMVLALAATNLQLRWDDPAAAVLPWGIVVSAVLTLMVMVAGWLGGTLTFRHGIGTYVHEHETRGNAQGDTRGDTRGDTQGNTRTSDAKDKADASSMQE